MGRGLSQDLRGRVVAAVAGGVSCRQAALRFGVSAASAIRWRQLALAHGTAAAKAQGGDRRSARIEAQAGFLLGAIKEKDDVTLSELQGLLARRGTLERARQPVELPDHHHVAGTELVEQTRQLGPVPAPAGRRLLVDLPGAGLAQQPALRRGGLVLAPRHSVVAEQHATAFRKRSVAEGSRPSSRSERLGLTQTNDIARWIGNSL